MSLFGKNKIIGRSIRHAGAGDLSPDAISGSSEPMRRIVLHNFPNNSHFWLQRPRDGGWVEVGSGEGSGRLSDGNWITGEVLLPLVGNFSARVTSPFADPKVWTNLDYATVNRLFPYPLVRVHIDADASTSSPFMPWVFDEDSTRPFTLILENLTQGSRVESFDARNRSWVDITRPGTFSSANYTISGRSFYDPLSIRVTKPDGTSNIFNRILSSSADFKSDTTRFSINVGESAPATHTSPADHTPEPHADRTLTVINLPARTKIIVDNRVLGTDQNSTTISNSSHRLVIATTPRKSMSIPASSEDVTIDANSDAWTVETTHELPSGRASVTKITYKLNYSRPDTYGAAIRYAVSFNGEMATASDFDSTFVTYEKNVPPSYDVSAIVYDSNGDIIPNASGVARVTSGSNLSLNSNDALTPDPPASSSGSFRSRLVMLPRLDTTRGSSSTEDLRNYIRQYYGSAATRMHDADVLPAYRYLLNLSSANVGADAWGSALYSIILRVKSATADQLHDIFSGSSGAATHPPPHADDHTVHTGSATVTVSSRPNGVITLRMGSNTRTATLDGSGRATVNDLEPGSWTVQANGIDPLTIVVSSGQNTSVTMTGNPASSQNGVVAVRGVGGNGSVSLSPSSGHKRVGSEWTYDDVSPGNYIVNIIWNDGVSQHFDLHVNAGSIVDVSYEEPSQTTDKSYITQATGAAAGILILCGIEVLKKYHSEG